MVYMSAMMEGKVSWASLPQILKVFTGGGGGGGGGRRYRSTSTPDIGVHLRAVCGSVLQVQLHQQDCRGEGW